MKQKKLTTLSCCRVFRTHSRISSAFSLQQYSKDPAIMIRITTSHIKLKTELVCMTYGIAPMCTTHATHADTYACTCMSTACNMLIA